MPTEIIIRGSMGIGKTVLAAVITQELQKRGYTNVHNRDHTGQLTFEETRQIRGHGQPIEIRTEVTQ